MCLGSCVYIIVKMLTLHPLNDPIYSIKTKLILPVCSSNSHGMDIAEHYLPWFFLGIIINQVTKRDQAQDFMWICFCSPE